MKKIFVRTVGAVLAAGILYFGTVLLLHGIWNISFWPFRQSGESAASHYERLFRDEYPTQFLCWKNEVDFQDDIPSETIENIRELENCIENGDYDNTILLIIDLDDELRLDDTELEGILRLVKSGVHLMYFGSDYLEYFHDAFGMGAELTDEDRSLVFFHEYHIGITPIMGIWTTTEDEIYKTDRELLQNQILECAEEYIIVHNKRLRDYEMKQ